MGRSDGPSWVTASELAENEFCPRAHWYHVSRGNSDPEDPRAAAGTAYHSRALRGVRRRAQRRSSYLGLLVGATLLVVISAFLLLHGG